MADDEQAARPRVLVLGGGFAGVGAARALKKADVDVVVVDKHDYHTFQPLLYQVATALLEPAEVGHPLRDLFDDQKNARVHVDSVTGDRPRQARGPVRGDEAADLRLPRARRSAPRSTSSAPPALPSTRSRCTRSPTPSA